MGRLPRIERHELPVRNGFAMPVKDTKMQSPLSSCYRVRAPLVNLGARGAVASGLATAGLAGWQVIVPVRVPFLIRGS